MRKYELPDTVNKLVVDLCGDYQRMKQALKRRELDSAVKLSYYTYTVTIYGAVRKASGLVFAQAEELIEDIAHKRGYQRSALSRLMVKSRYARAKKRAAYLIAARLYLIDSPDTPTRPKGEK